MNAASPGHPDWQAAHDSADAGGQDGYLDPQSGLYVFTAGFLTRRGTCCTSDCRHCPYDR